MIIENVLAVPVEFFGLLAQEGAAVPAGGAVPVGGPAVDGAAQNPGGLGVLFENPPVPNWAPVSSCSTSSFSLLRRSGNEKNSKCSHRSVKTIVLSLLVGFMVLWSPPGLRVEVVTIRIDDKQNVRIRVNRSAIAKVAGETGVEQSDSGKAGGASDGDAGDTDD